MPLWSVGIGETVECLHYLGTTHTCSVRIPACRIRSHRDSTTAVAPAQSRTVAVVDAHRVSLGSASSARIVRRP